MALTAFLVAGAATVSLGLLITSTASNKAARALREKQSASLAAEAGMNAAYVDFVAGGAGAVGSAQAPVELGGASFFVEATDLGDDVFSLVATGLDDRAGSRQQLVLRRTVETTPLFAAFGDEGLTMDSNAHVDSYDSSAGDYDSQQVNKVGNSKWANTNGNVGSNASIELRTNGSVHGNATPGPSGTVTITGNAAVSGATTPASELQDLPPLEIPVGTPSGDFVVDGSENLGPGTYYFDEFTIESNSQLDLTGPITIVANSAVLASNAEMILDAANGGAEIFVYDDFVLNSNTLITSTSNDPADFTINLDSNNVIDPDLDVDLDEVDFESNAKLYGTIYAPNAYIEINSNFELFGAVIARRVHLDSNSQVHFDEHLAEVSTDEEPVVETLFWRELPYNLHGEQVTPDLAPTDENGWYQGEGDPQ